MQYINNIWPYQFFSGKLEEDNCMHRRCPECKGTGITQTGSCCVHSLSCPCRRCSPSSTADIV